MRDAPTCACGCGRPVADGYARHECALKLAQALTVAAGHAEDAEAVIARQTRYGAGSRGGSGQGLTPDPKRIARFGRIVEAVSGWADILVEETGRRPRWRPYLGPLCAPAPPGDDERDWSRCDHDSCATARRREALSTLALDAMWLARPRQTDELRQHPAAGEAIATLHRACDDLARFVDRPADRDLVGMCDCGKVLYAAHGRTVVQCPQPTCKLVWNVDRSRDILRDALRGKLFTAAEAAHFAAHWDDRTSEQIRKLINKWNERGRIAAHGTIGSDPIYLFGDVLDRLAQSPPRRTAMAA